MPLFSDTDEIRESLLDFIVRHFVVDRTDINLENSLIDDGIIDSFGLIEICAYLTRTYAITIEDQDMIRENFGSVTRIVRFVKRKLTQ